MPRSWSQTIRSMTVKLTGTASRPRARGTQGRLVSVVVSSLVVMGLAAHGQLRETKADPAQPQQPASASPAPSSANSSPEVEAAAARRETLERLKGFEGTSVPDAAAAATTNPKPVSGSNGGAVAPGSAAGAATPPHTTSATDHAAHKSIREILNDRIHWLDEYAKMSLALKDATNPDPSPEQQSAQAKAELSRLETKLAQAAKAPETLLPSSLNKSSGGGAGALGPELKDAVAATTNEVKDWKTKSETLRGEIGKWEGQQNARRLERDRVFQRVASLKVKSGEFEAAVADAQTAESKRLAQERLVNFQWEERVETLSLQVIEAQLVLEVKLAGVRELELHVYRAHAQLAERTLEQMRARFSVASESRERSLTAAAADEEKTARKSKDPLERFRSRRTAELLVLEVQVLKTERAEATSPPPTYEEQRTLADRALKDFEGIKELLEDGRVSRLDAIRLNNDFRRIGPERDHLLRNEMSVVESQLQFYEDALTNVEIELIQDSLHDRLEHDLLRERVSAARWAEGEALLDELERTHRGLLMRRRAALERLSERTSHTLQQVVRRLGILDEEYGFIRTQIFWVRDQDPIGLGTLAQGTREFNYLVTGLLRLVQEIVKPNLWGQPSAEFLVTAVVVLALPLGLVRLRRGIWRHLERELPARYL
jgi:hypothetical protein